MKKKTLIIAILFFASLFIGCRDDNSLVAGDQSMQNIETELIADAIDSLPKSDLSDGEEEGLIFMREEEKLARDVYLYFYEKYGMGFLVILLNQKVFTCLH